MSPIFGPDLGASIPTLSISARHRRRYRRGYKHFATNHPYVQASRAKGGWPDTGQCRRNSSTLRRLCPAICRSSKAELFLEKRLAATGMVRGAYLRRQTSRERKPYDDLTSRVLRHDDILDA